MSDALSRVANFQTEGGWEDFDTDGSMTSGTDGRPDVGSTDIDGLDDFNSDGIEGSKAEEKVETKTEEDKAGESKEESQPEELEYTADGKTFKTKYPTREQVVKLLSRAHGAARKHEAAAETLRQAEKKLAEAKAAESSKARPSELDRAAALAGRGHAREALLELISVLPEGQKILESFIEDDREYQRSEPLQRTLKDAERKARSEELQRLRYEEELKAKEEALSAKAEAETKETYLGHIRDGLARYDLSQWIEDKSVATELNSVLKSAALHEIRLEAKRRDEAGKPALDAQDIKKIVASKAKVIAQSHIKRADKQATVDTDKKAAEAKEKMTKAATKPTPTQDSKARAAEMARKVARGEVSMQDIFRSIR